jgi:hypothetical protein
LKRNFIERFQFSIRNNFDLSVETIFADGACGGWIATTAVFFQWIRPRHAKRTAGNKQIEWSRESSTPKISAQRELWLRVRQIGAYGAICRDPDASPGDGADRVGPIVSAAGG